jgi:hypothetical protein
VWLYSFGTGFYKLNGRIPWSDIAENPSNHLKRKSRPDSDHKLEEPSHMKSDAVDSWIGHWLKIQKKNKRPLVLKSGSDSTSDKRANPIKVSRRRRNKRKDRYIDSDDTDDEAASNDETTDEADDDGLNGDEHGTRPKGAGKSGKGAATATDVQGTEGLTLSHAS